MRCNFHILIWIEQIVTNVVSLIKSWLCSSLHKLQILHIDFLFFKLDHWILLSFDGRGNILKRYTWFDVKLSIYTSMTFQSGLNGLIICPHALLLHLRNISLWCSNRLVVRYVSHVMLWYCLVHVGCSDSCKVCAWSRWGSVLCRWT